MLRKTTRVSLCIIIFGMPAFTSYAQPETPPQTQKNFAFSEFNKIDAEGVLDIQVTIGSPQKIEFFGTQEQLDQLDIKVSEKELKIGHKSSFWKSWTGTGKHNDKRSEIRITVPSLVSIDSSGASGIDVTGINGTNIEIDISGSSEINLKGKIGDLKIDVSGSGEVVAESLDAKKTEVEVSGSGDVKLKGKSDSMVISVEGSGEIKAQDLKVRVADVSITGSGEAKVNVAENLKGKIRGSAKLQYFGNPEKVSVKSSGSAELIKN